MNFSKKHRKLDFQKDASMIAGSPVSARMMYWKDLKGLDDEELAYLINDGWHLYGKTVIDLIFSKEGL